MPIRDYAFVSGNDASEVRKCAKCKTILPIYRIPAEVLDIQPYVDVLILWFKSLDTRQSTQLHEVVGRVSPASKLTKNRRWQSWKLTLLQPSRSILHAIAAVVQFSHSVSYVELALDLVTRSVFAAEELARWVWTHMVQLRRSTKQPLTVYKGGSGTTLYSGRRKGTNVIASYFDKPSKITSRPCLHIERRLRGPATPTLEELCSFDHLDFWNSHGLVFEEPNFKAIGRAYRRKHDKPEQAFGPFRHSDRRVGIMVARIQMGKSLWQTEAGVEAFHCVAAQVAHEVAFRLGVPNAMRRILNPIEFLRASGQVGLLDRVCQSCNRPFLLCRPCNRGDRYCSDRCRADARREQTRIRVSRYRDRSDRVTQVPGAVQGSNTSCQEMATPVKVENRRQGRHPFEKSCPHARRRGDYPLDSRYRR